MSIADICNTVAWVLCAVVGILLFSDFIRTELRFRREQEEKEASGHDTAE